MAAPYAFGPWRCSRTAPAARVQFRHCVPDSGPDSGPGPVICHCSGVGRQAPGRPGTRTGPGPAPGRGLRLPSRPAPPRPSPSMPDRGLMAVAAAAGLLETLGGPRAESVLLYAVAERMIQCRGRPHCIIPRLCARNSLSSTGNQRKAVATREMHQRALRSVCLLLAHTFSHGSRRQIMEFNIRWINRSRRFGKRTRVRRRTTGKELPLLKFPCHGT